MKAPIGDAKPGNKEIKVKIFRRAEFLALPDGAIFAKGRPLWFEGFMVKGETADDDFYYRDLMAFDWEDDKEFMDRFHEMLDKGAEYPLNESFVRDGLPDEEDVFLVYGDEDLRMLSAVIDESRPSAMEAQRSNGRD